MAVVVVVGSITIVAVAVAASSKLTWINSYKIIGKIVGYIYIHTYIYIYLRYYLYMHICAFCAVSTTTIYNHSLLFTASKTENGKSKRIVEKKNGEFFPHGIQLIYIIFC